MDMSTIDRSCVQVFARISASITHEMKNTLSIINENAGLLEDLAEMAGEDGGVPQARVRAATTAIARQVARSNTIMKDLNRFAHSTDSPVVHGRLADTLSLVVALTGRQAAMKNIVVRFDCPEELVFSTYLIYLEALIYLILTTLFQKSGADNELTISATASGAEIVVDFRAREAIELPPTGYADEGQRRLAEALAVSWRQEGERLQLRFPAVIEPPGEGSASGR